MERQASTLRLAPAYFRRAAMKFVVLLGIVSLFADMTYEGARSVTGLYLAMLGASGLTVGIIAGFGELVGYGLRLISGYLADKPAGTGLSRSLGISSIFSPCRSSHSPADGSLPRD